MHLALVRDRPLLILSVALTAAIGALVAFEAILQWDLVAGSGHLGEDLTFYRSVGERWLQTGQLYQPAQLAGPYASRVDVDVLYPPLALLLFVPFAVLPGLLWWAIPLGLVALVIVRMRPRPWTWPLFALIALWPRTMGGILFGNTDMWVAGVVAAGILWGWPATLILIKPTFAPLALIGVRRRAWWIALGVLTALSIAMLPLWFDYLTAMRNVEALPLDYSFANLPIALVPIVAWLGRDDRGGNGAIAGPSLWRGLGDGKASVAMSSTVLDAGGPPPRPVGNAAVPPGADPEPTHGAT